MGKKDVHIGVTSMEDFWEITRAFHKRHGARGEGRAAVEERLRKTVPGLVKTEEIDAALGAIHDKTRFD